MTGLLRHWLSNRNFLLAGKIGSKKAGEFSPASRLNDQVNYLFFSVATRKAMRPSSRTFSPAHTNLQVYVISKISGEGFIQPYFGEYAVRRWDGTVTLGQDAYAVVIEYKGTEIVGLAVGLADECAAIIHGQLLVQTGATSVRGSFKRRSQRGNITHRICSRPN